MAEHQSSSFTGVERNNLRPGSYVNDDDAANVCKDQAYLYERITGVKVPGSSSISATPHKHSGASDGAIIPIPLAQSWINLSMLSASAGVDGYSEFARHPVFIPAGVSKVQITLYCNGPDAVEGLNIYVQDSGLGAANAIGFPVWHTGHWSGKGTGDPVASCSVAVTGGEVNVFTFSTIDSQYFGGNRMIWGYTIHPVTHGPTTAIKAVDASIVTAGEYNTPSDFIGVDTAFTGPDRSVNSWLATTMAKNDQVNFELATNFQSGAKSSTDVTGHNHADGTVASGKCGAGIDLSLGSWSYGVARARDLANGASSEFMTLDQAGAGVTGAVDTWSGRIYGPHYSSTRTTIVDVAKHRFRIPVQTDGNLGIGGSANKFKVAVLSRTDHSSGTSTIGLQTYDDTETNAGTRSTYTVSGTDTLDLTVTALDFHSSVTAGEPVMLVVDMQGPGSAADFMIHGVCAYFEA